MFSFIVTLTTLKNWLLCVPYGSLTTVLWYPCGAFIHSESRTRTTCRPRGSIEADRTRTSNLRPAQPAERKPLPLGANVVVANGIIGKLVFEIGGGVQVFVALSLMVGKNPRIIR